MKTILSLIMLLLVACPAKADTPTGFWTGTAIRGGGTTQVNLRISETPQGLEARYDVPALGLEGMPVARFAFDSATGALTSSRALTARLEGGRITGTLAPYLLHGGPAAINLERAEAPPAVAQERNIEFVSRGFRMRGTLVAPQAAGRHPGIVSLHGSGPSTRWQMLGRARRFAEAGYVVLIFDKPGNGQSEGDWTVTSLDEMAQDALAAIEFLAAQPEVDPARVGLWGHSQAGQTISRAAALNGARIAFAMVLAGGGVTPREIEMYGYEGRFRAAGADAETVAKAEDWLEAYFAYQATGEGYQAVVDRLAADPEAAWVRALGVQTVYPTPEQQPKWAWVSTYDPAADIAGMRMPVLLMFGTADEATPLVALDRWRQALARGGNTRVEARVFEGAGHHFHIPAETDGWPALADGFYATQIDWLKRNVGD